MKKKILGITTAVVALAGMMNNIEVVKAEENADNVERERTEEVKSEITVEGYIESEEKQEKKSYDINFKFLGKKKEKFFIEIAGNENNIEEITEGLFLIKHLENTEVKTYEVALEEGKEVKGTFKAYDYGYIKIRDEEGKVLYWINNEKEPEEEKEEYKFTAKKEKKHLNIRSNDYKINSKRKLINFVLKDGEEVIGIKRSNFIDDSYNWFLTYELTGKEKLKVEVYGSNEEEEDLYIEEDFGKREVNNRYYETLKERGSLFDTVEVEEVEEKIPEKYRYEVKEGSFHIKDLDVKIENFKDREYDLDRISKISNSVGEEGKEIIVGKGIGKISLKEEIYLLAEDNISKSRTKDKIKIYPFISNNKKIKTKIDFSFTDDERNIKVYHQKEEGTKEVIEDNSIEIEEGFLEIEVLEKGSFLNLTKKVEFEGNEYLDKKVISINKIEKESGEEELRKEVTFKEESDLRKFLNDEVTNLYTNFENIEIEEENDRTFWNTITNSAKFFLYDINRGAWEEPDEAATKEDEFYLLFPKGVEVRKKTSFSRNDAISKEIEGQIEREGKIWNLYKFSLKEFQRGGGEGVFFYSLYNSPGVERSDFYLIRKEERIRNKEEGTVEDFLDIDKDGKIEESFEEAGEIKPFYKRGSIVFKKVDNENRTLGEDIKRITGNILTLEDNYIFKVSPLIRERYIEELLIKIPKEEEKNERGIRLSSSSFKVLEINKEESAEVFYTTEDFKDIREVKEWKKLEGEVIREGITGIRWVGNLEDISKNNVILEFLNKGQNKKGIFNYFYKKGEVFDKAKSLRVRTGDRDKMKVLFKYKDKVIGEGLYDRGEILNNFSRSYTEFLKNNIGKQHPEFISYIESRIKEKKEGDNVVFYIEDDFIELPINYTVSFKRDEEVIKIINKTLKIPFDFLLMEEKERESAIEELLNKEGFPLEITENGVNWKRESLFKYEGIIFKFFIEGFFHNNEIYRINYNTEDEVYPYIISTKEGSIWVGYNNTIEDEITFNGIRYKKIGREGNTIKVRPLDKLLIVEENSVISPPGILGYTYKDYKKVFIKVEGNEVDLSKIYKEVDFEGREIVTFKEDDFLKRVNLGEFYRKDKKVKVRFWSKDRLLREVEDIYNFETKAQFRWFWEKWANIFVDNEEYTIDINRSYYEIIETVREGKEEINLYYTPKRVDNTAKILKLTKDNRILEVDFLDLEEDEEYNIEEFYKEKIVRAEGTYNVEKEGMPSFTGFFKRGDIFIFYYNKEKPKEEIPPILPIEELIIPPKEEKEIPPSIETPIEDYVIPINEITIKIPKKDIEKQVKKLKIEESSKEERLLPKTGMGEVSYKLPFLALVVSLWKRLEEIWRKFLLK